MSTEYIAVVDLDIDESWEFSEELSISYLENMVDETGFDSRTKVFDSFDEANRWIVSILEMASKGGLCFSGKSTIESEEYLRGLAGAADAIDYYGEVVGVAERTWGKPGSCHGGYAFCTECGEWGSFSGVATRIDGEVVSFAGCRRVEN